jgi:predicted HNH restriction endonuclease
VDTVNERVKRWAKAHPEKHRAAVRAWERENPERRREITQKSQAKRLLRLRQEAIAALGGVCAICQCADIRCLQIDHVTPLRGAQRLGSVALYRSIILGARDGLQVLCANCHAIKTYCETYGDGI